MKKVVLILFVSILSIGAVSAQKSVKLGHIDSNELLKIMPGRDSAQAKLQAKVTEFENTLKSMQSEFETRYNEYLAGEAQMSDLIKQTKQKTLRDMQARIEEFQMEAQKSLQEKEKELLSPIIEKAKNAISEVAKENNYTYVFDAGVGVLLYQQDSDDILPMVKKKLNLK